MVGSGVAEQLIEQPELVEVEQVEVGDEHRTHKIGGISGVYGRRKEELLVELRLLFAPLGRHEQGREQAVEELVVSFVELPALFAGFIAVE